MNFVLVLALVLVLVLAVHSWRRFSRTRGDDDEYDALS
jgi:hypothetical protein